MKPLNILFISSMPPDYSAGLARDFMKALRLHGHNVDFLTRYDFPGQKENEYNVYNKGISDKIRKFCRKHPFTQYFRFLRFLLHKDKMYPNKSNGIIITNKNERKPGVKIEDLLSKITKPYDVVVTLFWQHMLTTVSLKAIYDKLHCPIIIRSVDMFTFTGGCFYFMNCRNFIKGCGCCPSLESKDPNDQTHKNFLTKKEMYASMNYAIGLNTWMQRFAIPTGLFDRRRIISTSAAVDENLFKPMSKVQCRKELGIDKNKTFVMFARNPNPLVIGKGFLQLVESVNRFSEMLSESERSTCLLVLAGEAENDKNNKFKIDTYYTGQLSKDDLIKAYNASNAFLSPSIDDAGPSMVNQSIMCGTPVICFEIGTALDVIENGKSGFKVTLKDTKAFASAIYKLYTMKEEKYEELCSKTRSIAMEHDSLESFAQMIENTYNLLHQRGMVI